MYIFARNFKRSRKLELFSSKQYVLYLTRVDLTVFVESQSLLCAIDGLGAVIFSFLSGHDVVCLLIVVNLIISQALGWLYPLGVV